MSFKGKKIAFLFPGQGAQYIEMAKDYIENDSELESVLSNFDTSNNVNLKKIMLEGPESELKQTKFTQPAILFHSISAMKSLLNKIDIKPDYVAGHSLGEFSALVANNVLSFEDAMYLVHKRGEFMINANDNTPFAMAAILGLSPDKVKEICEIASETGIVVAANYNTPVQTVISGSELGVNKACEIAKNEKAKRIVPLKVGGPFHSPLIAKAGKWLSEEMNNIVFNNTSIPVVSNVDASPTCNPTTIKENLTKQITSSVLWVDSINYMINNGVDVFIEFGPQKVLTGMMRKINKRAKIFSIDTLNDIEKVKKGLEDL